MKKILVIAAAALMAAGCNRDNSANESAGAQKDAVKANADAQKDALNAQKDAVAKQASQQKDAIEAQYQFWPWLQEPDCLGVEPDVLIQIRDSRGTTHLILIEAKYRSGKSSFAEPYLSVSPNRWTPGAGEG